MSGGGMPEIGSKISLISKADIRYEGRLFTVDPQECTIALANVRSFGTEDRETQYPIAPQSQVYDYILFRGSDIKDIRVVNNVPPLPNDPAIMQMQLQNQMGHQNFQPQFPVPVMGPYGQFAPYGAMGNMGAGLAPGSLPAGLTKKQPSEFNVVIPEPDEHKDQASVLDFIAGGSRSTTPISLVSRKSPTADMAVQVNQPRSSSRDMKQRNNQQRGRDRHDSGRGGGDNQNKQQDNKQPMQNQRPNHHQASSGNNQVNHQNNQGNNQQQSRGWNRGGNFRGRGRGRGGPNQYDHQAFRQPGPNQKQGRSKTIKFDSDYDFEQANSKFEELRTQLAKLKVGEEAKPEQQDDLIMSKVNGETDKKDDSGNETGAGDNEQEEEDVNVGYDKTKSFFDNISCEASIERNKGKNRTDWRQERKLNSETFGISSTRRGGFLHSYRGRGGGGYFNNNRNMGGGGGYRGGYRGNFRGRGTGRPGGQNMGGYQHQQKQQPSAQQNTTTAVAAAPATTATTSGQ